MVGKTPGFLVTHPGFQAKTVQDLLSWGRTNPDRLSVAIAGTGSVVVDLFRALSGVKFVTVPYPGNYSTMHDSR